MQMGTASKSRNPTPKRPPRVRSWRVCRGLRAWRVLKETHGTKEARRVPAALTTMAKVHLHGATWSHWTTAQVICVSIRAPCTCTGRRVGAGAAFAPCAVSIRAPCTCTGRPVVGRDSRDNYVVSIRAPCTCTGRQSTDAFIQCDVSFQSAPRALARGDARSGEWLGNAGTFQSAPRALARGDCGDNACCGTPRKFQSAPRALARGDADW